MIARAFLLSLIVAFATAQGASASVIADFTADFQTPTPAAGWSYLYTATGGIGNSANYLPLSYDSGHNWYDATPGSFPSSSPHASYTLVASGFMHPGDGSGQGTFEHFTIAAYTLSSGGPIWIKNLTTTDGDPSSGDGVEFWVGVNNIGSIVGGFPNGGSFSDPSIFLGNLNAGDTIYVATGAKGDNFNDSTNIEFQITSVPEPSSLVALCGLAAMGLFIAVRRRRKS